MKANWTKRALHFKQPAGTSRGIMKTRDVWYITLYQDGITGIGECAPLPGLSLDNCDLIESKLGEICKNPEVVFNDLSQLFDFPSIRFGLEMASLDLVNGGGQNYYGNFNSININGLIWMGDAEFMVQQVEGKLSEGWKCIKIKIGAIDFEKELDILKSIRLKYDKEELELRVDANGAFTKNDVHEKLEQLSKLDLHSIEQPIQPGQWKLLSDLCNSSPVSIALDEELISVITEKNRIEMLEKVKPQYLVLKPSLLGGFSESEKWIQLAKEQNIGWWITSALESNIGLNAISQWTANMKPKGFQGLGTGKLFTNNVSSPLKVDHGILSYEDLPIWYDVNYFISDWYSPKDEMTLQTSGSTGKPKSISVKKEWMKNSANLTAKTFGLKEGDSALLCMPMKFVAGKMMVVRSLELGLNLKVVEPSSTPLEGINEPIDFAAMVPLQLEDSLDQLGKVKTLIVGGGQVNPSLVERLQKITTIDDPTLILPYDRGENQTDMPKQLSSPCIRGNTRGSINNEKRFTYTQVFETYGMTESLTHVAIKPLNGPKKSDVFQALDGVHFELDDRGCLVIHAPSILSLPASPSGAGWRADPPGGVAWQSHFMDSHNDITSSQTSSNDLLISSSTIVTNDLVKLVDEKSFLWLGRVDNVINSGGVKIIPEVVEAKLTDVISNRRFFVAGIPDESLGQKVVLVVEGDEMEIQLKSLDKYERPKKIFFIDKFVETRTGKVSRQKTMKLID